MSEPYDPYIPNSPQRTPGPPGSVQGTPQQGTPQGTPFQQQGSPQQGTSDPRIAQLQSTLDDTMQQMKDNINTLDQRGDKINTLQDKTDNLAVSAQGFRRGANKVRKQMWWKDMKMRMCLIVGIIVLILVIVLPAVLATKK
ncbi:synaptobrevin-domain-containing protein [Lasiosphaeria miniovina]|uniref:Synaptobrevin-domain-containing protein n=2 Tax=Lasiosphaeria TaxID=92901 RepID=A0AA40DVB0_9PEZI|nr:synaptobrevin-domain-containing protein [Lasiosphaeria miniovina]KAK0716915.1 synaptobrevin-domain-containing protein [Lasiosphaeria miniovina]KAK3366843.1 putative snare protein Snc2 [Lasiosphaeria ovina]